VPDRSAKAGAHTKRPAPQSAEPVVGDAMNYGQGTTTFAVVAEFAAE
jgi:hypothetical protein